MSELKAKKYTLLSNILFSLNTLRRESPATLARAAVGVVARIAAPFAAILLPKLVLDGLTNHVSPAEFIASVGGGAAALAALTFLRGYTDVTLNPGQEIGMAGVNAAVTTMAVKKIDMDFELLSDPEVKKLEDKAGQALGSNHTPANNLPAYLANLLVQLGGFALYGAVIASVHWAILPLLALSAVVVGLMLRRARKYEEAHREELDETGMKFFYVVRSLNDAELAKDLRLYSMIGWIKANGNALFKKYRDQSGRVAGLNMQAQLAGAAMVLLRDGAAYALLVYLLLKERVTLGDFTLMFAAIGAFAGWVQGIIEQAGETLRASAQLAGYREYIDVPDRMNRGAGAPLPDTGAPPEIALENVSYKYPGADGCALENISLTIRAGERLAVVGVNGAGKSTLVKLICGLYRPTAGTIKLDGTDISRFNRDEYYTLFTAVF
ncbi:MAG: ABC transporter ATP-binding protein/permease, partial [Oscillospiraceae bacterium]|nr:ABC transporter ATP-binding protein/permease [Oscillospiraceae bacterium]